MTTSKRPRAQGEEADLRSRLDHLTLSRKEGFGRLADAPPGHVRNLCPVGS
ncbi:hypothetical protein AB0J21_24390 [Streptomyces sp. NPDC049954]|uniref:hypothetical protein n=1 Tax=Streptomyces sp. NPDC049954 TaxID=3155779 RepID=UPI00343C3440